MIALYDYLIVGSGLFGSVFAHEMTRIGKKCLVIEKRNHLGGNVFCESVEGIQVHRYGAHIFHTHDEEIWDYVNRFTKMNRFTNSPLASFGGRLFNLPFNMNTFRQVWGISDPELARKKIAEQAEKARTRPARNLEEQAIAMVGKDLYEMFIRGYTQKQWGRAPSELPALIIRRIPVRFTFDNNYFDHPFQGIPEGGYNRIIEGLLKGVEVRANVDYFENRGALEGLARRTVFTGKIDQFFDFSHGRLNYRSLAFKTKVLDQPDFQGNAVVNFTESSVPYTRVIEHKHFDPRPGSSTVVTWEYPREYAPGSEPYYPINDSRNNGTYELYRKKAQARKNIVFGGRLAEYRYYDMDQVISSALRAARLESAPGRL